MVDFIVCSTFVVRIPSKNFNEKLILLGVRGTARLFKTSKSYAYSRKEKSVKQPDVRSLKIRPDIKFNRWSRTTAPVSRLVESGSTG